MILSENDALSIVSLESMKTELRIPLPTPTNRADEHDELLAAQITAAANFVAQSAGVGLADLGALRPAIVSSARSMYNGAVEITPAAAANAFVAVYRDYSAD